MEDEGVNPEQEADFRETEYTQDGDKKCKRKVPKNEEKKRRDHPKDMSPHRSSSSYTTADEQDQVQWIPSKTSVPSYSELLARNKELEKLYEDKCKIASALKHELDCYKDTSCIDASLGQLSSTVETGIRDPLIHEKLKEYQAAILERDDIIKSLAVALKEKITRDDVLEKEKENLLQKVKLLEQQALGLTASIQTAPTAEAVSVQVFQALQNENLQLKQELAHKDLLYQEACTKQFSLEADLRELEERNRQQEGELRTAIAVARRAQINEDSKQVETLLENIGLTKDEENDSGHVHLWQEVMSAQEQAHQLRLEKLENEHHEDLVLTENALRLEMMKKMKDLENKHFEEISAMSEQLNKKFQSLNDEVKKIILLQLSSQNGSHSDETTPSIENILLCLDQEEIKEKMESQIRSLVSHQVELTARSLEEQHKLNLRRHLANQDLVQQQELAALRTSLEHEKQLQITHLHEELSKRHKEEINELIQVVQSERQRLTFYVASGGCGMSLLKKQCCMEYKAAFQGLVSSWYGQWKQEMASISARLDFLSDTPQTNQDSELTESLQLIGLEETDSLLGEQERLLSEAKDIGQRLTQHMKSSLGDIMKALELEHSRVVERIEEMRSELEEAGAAARLQALVDRLRLEKSDLQNSHKVALENMSARHENEVARLRRLVQEVQAGGESDALKAQQLELEQKHQQEMEELRSYFEQKCADVGKNYSEEVYSQHSRKMSGSNCSSECELGSEIYYTGPGAGMVSLCGSSSAGDGSRQVQHVYDACVDHNCKEKEENLSKEFQEQLEAQRLTLESRYFGEVETLKEEYELRVKELVRDMTQSHNEEISFIKAKLEEEKCRLCTEIKNLKETVSKVEAERNEIQLKMESLKEETLLLSGQKEKLQTDYEELLKEVDSLKELKDVPCHEVSREIETTTEEWIDSLEIITEPKENAGVKWGKKSELEGLKEVIAKQEEEIAALQKRLIIVPELERKCSKLSERFAELKQNCNLAGGEKIKLESRYENLIEKCTEMEQRNEHLKKECLDWELKYIDLNKVDETLKLQLNSVNVELESVLREKETLLIQINDLKMKLDKQSEEEKQLKNELADVKGKLKCSEESRNSLVEELGKVQSDKENYLARIQSELKEKHLAELERMKNYYEELKNRSAEGQEDESQHCELKKLREDLNESLQREKDLLLKCRQQEDTLEKKEANILHLTEMLKRKETEATHQIAVLKTKLRESHDTIDWYDKRTVPQEEMRTEACGAPSKVHCPSETTEVSLATLFSQIEAQYAEHFRLVLRCTKESQVETAVKYVRALEQLHQQHERELSQLDLPTKQSFSRRGSACCSNHSGDGNCSTVVVPTLEDLLVDNGFLNGFNQENVQILRKISEELEAKHQFQVEGLQATYAQQLKDALAAKDQEFERLASELRLEQETQMREVQLEADRRFKLRLEEAREDIVNTLETSVQALLTDDTEEGERPLELQKLEEKLSAKYRRELEVQKQIHDAEIQKLRQQFDARTQRKGVKNAALLSERLAVVTSERNSLRTVAATLRDLVFELVRYFVSCEDRMNSTLMEELVVFGQDLSILRSARKSSDSENYVDDGTITPPEDPNCSSLVPVTPNSSCFVKRVRFAENLSGVVKCIDDPTFLRFVDVCQSDASMELQEEIDNCVSQLRSEAEALFALSQKAIAEEEEKMKLMHSETQSQQRPDEEPAEQSTEQQDSNREGRRERRKSSREVVFEEFGDQLSSPRSAEFSPRGKILQDLMKRARVQLPDIPQISLFLEELCRDWERLVEDFRREEENLRQQVKTADKQLRDTRSFMEEQVAEREQERDEIQRLRDMVREKDRERTSIGNMSKEVESLTHQLHDAIESLKEAEKKMTLLEEERDYSLDKVKSLQENVSELESQLLKKMQQEASLEMRIKMLQNLTEQQGKTHLELAQECENLRKDSVMTEEVRALQEKLQQYELFVKEGNQLQTMQEMRSQLGDIELLVECRTKLLENASAAAPGSPSLSSPSEDISIRETVEVMRSILREENEKRQTDKLPSLPLDAVSRLEEKMQRHVRAEEALIKKIRDLDMQLNSIRSNQTEIQTERDLLADRLQEQLLQTAQLEARIDELRRKGDSSQKHALNSIKGQLSEAQTEIGALKEDLETKKRKCEDLQKTLECTQSALQKKEREVNQIAESHQYLIEQLKTQIAKNLKEKEKLKELYCNKSDSSTTLPLLVDSMLADKNADIDMLENQVAQLKKQIEAPKREKRDQRCSPIPYESSNSHSTSYSLQQSGVSCEYSATPGSTFEYRETEKLRAHVELSPIIELQRSINISDIEPNLRQKLDENSHTESPMAHLSLPRLVSPQIQPRNIDLQTTELLPILENDSMGSSIVPEQSQQDAEPSQTSDRDDTLQSTIDELRTTLANLTNDNNSLKDELTIKNSEVKALTEQLRSSQELLANLQSKLEEARWMAEQAAASADLAKENSDLKDRCVSIRSELEENFKQRENELRRLLEAEQNAARAAHHDLEAVRHELEQAREQGELLANLQEQMKAAEEDKILLESEVEKLRQEISSVDFELLNNKLQNEKEFSKALKEELNICRVRITELERNLARLEDEKAEKINEALSRLAELKKAQNQIEFLLGENSRLDAELTALRAQHKVDQEEQNRSEFLIQELTHLREENLEVGREMTELKKNMNKMRQDEAVRANHEHKELRHLLRDNAKLKKELTSLRRAIEGVYGDDGPPSPDGSGGGLSNEDRAIILSLRNKMDCLALKLDSPKEVQKRSRLSRTAVLTNEYCPPGSPIRESESLEDLSGLVRRELDVSAHLDDTLLQSLQPLGNRDKTTLPSTSQTKDNIGRAPQSADLTEKKNTQLAEVLQQLKNNNLKLGTELSETRCAVRLLQNQLEIERSRYKVLQEQDSNLIETMRIKLEQALDSEAQLKNMLETERLQKHKPLHQVSTGGDELVKSPHQLPEHYHETDSCRANVEKQMKVLESQLARALEELEQRRVAQEVLVKKARELELRRSRKRAAEEEQHRQKLDLANMRLEDLQKELEGSRRQLRAVSQDLQESRRQEECLKRELAEIRTSQLQDHRNILQELDNMKKHVTEKNYLTEQVKNLMEERNQLLGRVNQLEGEVTSRMENDNWSESARLKTERGGWERERNALHAALTQATQKQCSHDSDFEDRVNYLFGKYLRCESYRKALVWQKRYLLLVVNSYHEARSVFLLDSNLESRLHCPRPIATSAFERDCIRRRHNEMRPINRFRLAALVIKAIARMRFLVQRWNRSRRIGSNVVMCKTFVQQPSDLGSDITGSIRRNVPPVSVPVPSVGTTSVGMAGDAIPAHPFFERASSSSRVPVHRSSAPWSTETNLAAYISRFNVMHQRFEAMLAQTPNS